MEHGHAALWNLIRITRRERARMSQSKAATAAGFSTVWWRLLETGQRGVPPETVGRMCYAIGVTPKQLDDLGYPVLANEVRKREQVLTMAESPYTDPAERHLWETPGTDAATRHALITHLRILRVVAASDDPYTRVSGLPSGLPTAAQKPSRPVPSSDGQPARQRR